MAYRTAVISYLDGLLQPEKFSRDPSVNGLQVEGNEMVNKLVFGVDASEALFRAAIEVNADMIVVHHGLFWEGMSRRITGLMASRIRMLLSKNISLYAMHLPLDAHPEFGHNICLAQMIGLQERQTFFQYAGHEIGVSGALPIALTARNIGQIYEPLLNADIQIFGRPEKICKRVGIVSGGAGISGINAGIERSLDCMVVGEFEHAAWHLVQESDMTVIALGHYASEQPGLLALLNKLRDDLDISCSFIDLPTGL